MERVLKHQTLPLILHKVKQDTGTCLRIQRLTEIISLYPDDSTVLYLALDKRYRPSLCIKFQETLWTFKMKILGYPPKGQSQ